MLLLILLFLPRDRGWEEEGGGCGEIAECLCFTLATHNESMRPQAWLVWIVLYDLYKGRSAMITQLQLNVSNECLMF